MVFFEQIERGNFVGHIAATTVTTIFYIVRKTEGRDVALSTIHRLLAGLQICPVNRKTVELALSIALKDFED
ncbi:MAG: PIN domain-containing protein [Cyanobacteria bacterium J06623_4]